MFDYNQKCSVCIKHRYNSISNFGNRAPRIRYFLHTPLSFVDQLMQSLSVALSRLIPHLKHALHVYKVAYHSFTTNDLSCFNCTLNYKFSI